MKSCVPEYFVANHWETCLKYLRCYKNSLNLLKYIFFLNTGKIKCTKHAVANFKFRKIKLYVFPMAIMLLLQASINVGIFIIAQSKHYYRNNKTANKKYYFEYLLLAIIQLLAVLAYWEHFLVMITAIIQLIGTLVMITAIIQLIGTLVMITAIIQLIGTLVMITAII